MIAKKDLLDGRQSAEPSGTIRRTTQIPFYLLTFLPLIALPFVSFGFETPKVLVFELTVLVLVLLLVSQHKLQHNRPQFLVGGGLLVLIGNTILFHYTPSIWFGNQFRLQGIFLQVILFAWMVIAGMKDTPKKHEFFPLLALLVLFVSGLFIQDAQTGRAIGLIGEANSFAGCGVLLSVFACMSVGKQKFARLLQVAIGLISLVLVLISGSRSGLLALLLAWMFLFVANKRVKLSINAALAVCFICLTLALPFISKQSIWDNRAQIWQTAVVAGSFHPIMGNGLGNITPALHQAAHILENPIEAEVVDSSHNIVLDWWVQGGLVGVGLFLGSLLYAISQLVKRKEVRELTLLIVCIELLLFNPVSVYILVVCWWCIGRGFGQNEIV